MRKVYALAALFVLLIAGIVLLETTKQVVYRDNAPLMLDATARTRTAFEALRAERVRRGYPVDAADDPNDTGMIGPMYTEITTTLGSLEAKRSTTNPNVAAMMVDMFTSLGIGPGDRVAVNLSGSFPALNIAMLCTMDTLGIDGTVLFSVGASTYGATIPEFTYGDMEHFLFENGFIATRSIGFSMGGQDDLGLEMPGELRDEISARLAGYDYKFLTFEDLDENIAARIALYDAKGPVRCFVNIGGNLLSFGATSAMHNVPGGVLHVLPSGENGNGLVQHYLRNGAPVMQLLNMKGLLPAYGLPFDPIPLPEDGAGAIYLTQAYNMPLVWILLAAGIAGLCVFSVLFRRKRKNPDAYSK